MSGGQFITIEGGEGAGKTTQIMRLKASFAQSEIDAVFTREPGGCESAESVRELLVTGEADRWLAESESLLMMAARFEHVKRLIEPSLSAGKWVISDRFFDSTRVYQGQARKLGDDWLQLIYRSLFGNLKPALTLYLDIDPKVGLARTQGRDGSEHRFETMALQFHKDVRKGFLAINAAEPERVAVIDASKSQDNVHQAMLTVINQRFGLQLMEQA